jgi:hypothetical protein
MVWHGKIVNFIREDQRKVHGERGMKAPYNPPSRSLLWIHECMCKAHHRIEDEERTMKSTGNSKKNWMRALMTTLFLAIKMQRRVVGEGKG